MSLEVCRVPGPPGASGFAHGRLIADLLEPGFHETYVTRLAAINRCEREDLSTQAVRWLAGLREHFQEEIEGMAAGARVGIGDTAVFLYADIARPTRTQPGPSPVFDPVRDPEPTPGEVDEARGPMCSAVVAGIGGGVWAARNCDWLTATLTRGTACVVHASPGRIPVMAVGIRGDIDVDTGMNAERLWLHLHTLLTMDDPPRDRTTISWLFWAREALERCATLDELERFIEATGPDRGVIAVAVDGKSGEGAVFECSRSGHRRVDFDPARPLFATNHTLTKTIDAAREAKARRESTVGRFCSLRSLLRDHPPEHGPDDLIELLGEEGVEMRTPTHLRTIYSAVADAAGERVWFASGGSDGRPAASGGRWARVRWRW